MAYGDRSTQWLVIHVQFSCIVTVTQFRIFFFCCSRNQICSLPPCLCRLPLRVLNASNNRLDSLPESIGQLHNLMELVWSLFKLWYLLVFFLPVFCCGILAGCQLQWYKRPPCSNWQTESFTRTKCTEEQPLCLARRWACPHKGTPLSCKNNSALTAVNSTLHRLMLHHNIGLKWTFV